MLARSIFVLRVLDWNAHVLEGEHGLFSQVGREIGDRELEVRARVESITSAVAAGSALAGNRSTRVQVPRKS